MQARGSAAVISALKGSYPEAVIEEQLRQLYYEQIWNVLDEIYKALPSYRARVSERTYTSEKTKLLVLVDFFREDEDCLSVRSLEELLKQVLEQQRVVTDVSN